ncbi:MAG: hypothetical protein ABEJ62_00865 [Candidatus Nanohaloarchaea archaeon]
MELRRERLASAALIVLFAVSLGYLYTSQGAPTGQVVKEYYELSTGQSAEVLKVEDRGSIDRVVVKPKNSEQVSTFYVTDDGRYIVRNPVNVDNSTARLRARNDFVSCLSRENATFYGILTSNRTFAQHTRMARLQIQVLGGVQGLQNVFGGMGTGNVRRAVLQNGVVWSVDGNFTAGLKTVPQLEKMTGCNYTAG